MALKQLNMGNVLMNLYATEKKKTFNPIRFVPRPYQKELDKRIEEEYKKNDGQKKPIFISWSRRIGKDQWAFSRAVECCINIPNFRVMYIFPTAKQGRKNILEGITIDGQRWIESVVDPQVIKTTKTGSLYFNDGSIKFKNGSMIDIYGDDADTILGSNLNMLIISEAAVVRESTFDYLLPSTRKVNGEIICISTPRLNSWFNRKFLNPEADIIKSIITAYDAIDNDGNRIYTDKELEVIKTLMSEEQFASDYMCDMTAFNELSIYGKSLKKATWIDMPIIEHKPIFVSFDLGISDNTAMTFAIFDEDNKIKIIHQHRNREKPTQYYIDYIKQFCMRYRMPQQMIEIILPQDGGSQMDYIRYLASRSEVYRAAGFKVTVLNHISVLRAIEITRTGIENGDIQFVNNIEVRQFTDVLKSYEWKVAVTGEPILVPKHGSGFSASNDADSLEYLAIYFLYEKYRKVHSFDSGVVFTK